MSEDKYTLVRYRIARELAHIDGELVLDVGCYDGYFLTTLDTQNTFGYDVDEEALEVARSRGIIILDKLCSPFKFGVVFCMEVLEHLQDPEEMLERLKPLGKRFIISLPNECNLWTRVRVLFGWGINDLPFSSFYHLHFPTLKQSDEFISKHFQIVKRRYWVYGPQFLKFLPTLFARGVIYECIGKAS